METDQAGVFGFPNPFIGLVAFPVLVTVSVVILAGTKFKRWFWLGLQAGTVFGVLFVHWLFYQSVHNIGALCPYCMVVWAVAIATFWYVTLANLRAECIKLPGKLVDFGEFVQRHHFDILLFWYLIIAGLIIDHFWYYFGALV